MYSVFTKLGDGEFLLLAAFKDLRQASKLVKDFNENFPHEYEIRDPNGNNIDLDGILL
jgi:hypothetical protein